MMEKKKLTAVKKLRDGYGNIFGFHIDGRYWASASAGLLYIWDEFSVNKSYEIPGYERGNIVFTKNGLIRIGLFELDYRNGEKKYHHHIVENFALQLGRHAPAHFSQYSIREVLNFDDEDMLVAAIAYQPSKLLGAKNNFSGPTNRLMVFKRSSGELLHVLAENYERISYANLISSANILCYTFDDDRCISLPLLNSGITKVRNELGQFVPFAKHGNNIISGSYNNNIIQFREAVSLKLTGQLSFKFEEVNAICYNEQHALNFVACNSNLLQCWNINNEINDTLQLSGTIEGVGTGKQNFCMAAVAGQENIIEVFSIN